MKKGAAIGIAALAAVVIGGGAIASVDKPAENTDISLAQTQAYYEEYAYTSQEEIFLTEVSTQEPTTTTTTQSTTTTTTATTTKPTTTTTKPTTTKPTTTKPTTTKPTTTTTKPTTTKPTTTTTKPTTTKPTTTADPNESITVYRTATGSCYHYENPCGNGTYYPISLAQAERSGLRPCEKCVLH